MSPRTEMSMTLQDNEQETDQEFELDIRASSGNAPSDQSTVERSQTFTHSCVCITHTGTAVCCV